MISLPPVFSLHPVFHYSQMADHIYYDLFKIYPDIYISSTNSTIVAQGQSNYNCPDLAHIYTKHFLLKTVTFLCICTFCLHKNGENDVENVFV